MKTYLSDRALSDFKASEVLMNETFEGHEDIAAYHMQQALEKLLKSYLLESTGRYPKTHDIATLLSESVYKGLSVPVKLHRVADECSHWIHNVNYEPEYTVNEEAYSVCFENFSELYDNIALHRVPLKKRVKAILDTLNVQADLDEVCSVFPEGDFDDATLLDGVKFALQVAKKQNVT